MQPKKHRGDTSHLSGCDKNRVKRTSGTIRKSSNTQTLTCSERTSEAQSGACPGRCGGGGGCVWAAAKSHEPDPGGLGCIGAANATPSWETETQPSETPAASGSSGAHARGTGIPESREWETRRQREGALPSSYQGDRGLIPEDHESFENPEEPRVRRVPVQPPWQEQDGSRQP